MQNGLLLGFIARYMLGTLAIGWWACRRVKTTADFVVAGKRLPMFIAACAWFATWFGSETVMGASSAFSLVSLFTPLLAMAAGSWFFPERRVDPMRELAG